MNKVFLLPLLILSVRVLAQSPPDEGLPFNKILYYMGSPDREYEDAYLYFRYTGIPEHLLSEIEAHHKKPAVYNAEFGCYEVMDISEPLHYYMPYRVRLDYTDQGYYKLWVQYEFDMLEGIEKDNVPNKPAFDDGHIIHDIARDWISLYQGIVDRALERSLSN